MKCTKLFLWLTVLLIITSNVNSQNAPITTVSSAVACPNDTIIISITASNCPYLTAISLQLDYDATVLSFINLNPNGYPGNFNNTNSSLYASGGDIELFPQLYAAPGFKMVRASWFSLSGTVPATVGNIAHLFDVSFRYYVGNTSIIFNNSVLLGQACEYADTIGNPYIDTPTANYYINGTVTQAFQPLQPGLINGNTHPIIGDTTVYSVANVAGMNYTWSAPSGWYGMSSSSSITYIVGSGMGIITVIPSNCAGTGLARTLAVTTEVGIVIRNTLTNDKEIKIYPNPANEILLVENAGNSKIEIYNLLGEMVIRKNCRTDYFSIDLSGLQENIYMVKISGERNVVVKRLVIVR